MFRNRTCFTVALCLIACATSLFAAQKKWDGAAFNTDWISGPNWDPDNVPTITDDIVLSSELVAIPGSMVVNAGVVGAQSITFASGFNSSNTVVIGNGSGSTSFLLLGGIGATANPIIQLNSSSGTVTFARKNGGTANLVPELGAPTTLNVNNGATLVFNCDIIGPFPITKTGLGTLKLSGTNLYSGATTIQQGTLALVTDGASIGSLSNSSSVTVMSGATFDVSAVPFTLNGSQTLAGSGAVNGNVSTAPGATLIAGPAGSAGTLLFSNNLALNGSTLVFDLASATTEAAGVNDQIAVNGSLSLSGSNIIFLNYLDGSLAPGTYRIIKFAGAKTGTFTLGAAYQNVSLDETTTPGYVTIVVSAPGSAALTLTWQGDGVNNVWDMATTQNWLNGVASSVYYNPAIAIFNDSGATTPAVNVATTVIPQSILVTANNSYTFSGVGSIGGIPGLGNPLIKSGSGTLTLSTSNGFAGGVDLQAGTLKIGNSNAIPSGVGKGDVSLAGTFDLNGNSIIVNGLSGPASGMIDNTAGGTSTLTLGANDASGTFSGVIKNTGGTLALSKIGSGTITLGGNNTFSGSVAIDNGALRAAHGNALGNTVGATTISGSAALGRLELSGGITVNENLVLAMKFGIGSGSKDFQIPHIVNVSGENTLNGAFTLNSGGTFWTFQSDAGKLIITKTLASTATGGRPLLLQGAGDGEIKGAIQNGSGQVALVKSGTGIWTLSGTNTYSQNTTIHEGALKIGNSNAIPSGAGKGDITVDGTLDLNGAAATVNGLSGSGIIDNTSPLASQLTVGANNRSGTFYGPIRNTSGALALTKTGTGTITLAGGNTYSGDTTIAQGTLKLGTSNVLPDGGGKGNLVVNGALDLGGNSDAINGLSGNGTIDTSGGGSPTLTIGNNNASGTFAGSIQNSSGTLSLAKNGSGTLTLNGTNSYTGSTVVNAGTLLINGSIGGLGVTVSTPATLGGTGTINGSVIVQSGATLSPGSSIGTFTINGDLTLSGTSLMEINKSGASLTSDLVSGVGTLLCGGTLTVTATGDALAENDTFNLFDASTFFGSFASINLPALPSCLVWDTSMLLVNGTIRVGPCPVQQFTVTGQLELQSFVGTTRTVTFVATGGASNKTWNSSLTFSGTPRVASYTLTDVPPNTTGISAKSSWNLRRKLAVTFSNGQAVANFTGLNNLLGGDISGTTTNAPPNNVVNTIDYIRLRALNGRTGAAAVPADITGNGSVNVADYIILRANIGRSGSAQ